ncbi:30S ribosomal protein S4 [Desulfothermobacter acidiphilus]|uniref:30S ribosomal protein S4 n=1 Tax=Desulfothermobacter acidiphilus TaxID=1938353 RepID=UPI003F8A1337
MARYTGSKCRLCRREGIKLYLKGDRCYTSKCALERRSYPPGQHGRMRRKPTEYALQLREKQRAKRIYGVLEAQFRNYFTKAERQKGLTGENLLRLLERRLDNVLYRLGLAASRSEARQLVRHGHVLVNGRRVDIPSYLVKVGDKISFAPVAKSSPRVQELLERAAQSSPPAWLRYDPNAETGEILAFPARDQIDVPVKEHLIVELYSR